jgi:hypothetical protein
MNMLKELWESKKFRAALTAMIVVVLGTTIGLEESQAESLVKILMAYIVGQGIADNGKEAEKVRNGGGL